MAASVNKNKLVDDEVEAAKVRRSITAANLAKLLGNPLNESTAPRIAVLFSGGGKRAMLAAAAVLDQLTTAENNVRWLDCVDYLAGVSGGSWAINLMAAAHHPSRTVKSNPFHNTTPDHLTFQGNDTQLLLFDLKQHKYDGVKKMPLEQWALAWDLLTLQNVTTKWAKALHRDMLAPAFGKQSWDWSFDELAGALKRGELPAMLCSCICDDAEPSAYAGAPDRRYDWVHISPFTATRVREKGRSNIIVPTSLLGFKQLPHLAAVCGSAYAGDAKSARDSGVPEVLLRGGNDPVCKLRGVTQPAPALGNAKTRLRDGGIECNLPLSAFYGTQKLYKVNVVLAFDATDGATSAAEVQKAIDCGYLQLEGISCDRQLAPGQSVQIFRPKDPNDPYLIHVLTLVSHPTLRWKGFRANAFTPDQIESYTGHVHGIVSTTLNEYLHPLLRNLVNNPINMVQLRAESFQISRGPKFQALRAAWVAYWTRTKELEIGVFRKVSIEKVFTNLSVTRVALRKCGAGNEVHLGDTVPSSKLLSCVPTAAYFRLMVLGNPGSGKSTLCKKLAYDQGDDSWPFDLVLRVSLKALAEKSYSANEMLALDAYTFYKLLLPESETSLQLPEVEFAELKILWLLDGYDEVQLSDKMCQFLDHHLKDVERKSFMNAVVCTTRWTVEPNKFPKSVSWVQLTPWDQEQRDAFMTAHLAAAPEDTAIGAREKIRRFFLQPTNIDFEGNPLMLELVCAVFISEYALDTTQIATVYGIIVQELVKRAETDGRITQVEKASFDSAPIGLLAFLSLTSPSPPAGAFRDIDDSYVKIGLLTPTDGGRSTLSSRKCGFPHQTLLEYFAARHIVDQLDEAACLQCLSQILGGQRPLEVYNFFVTMLVSLVSSSHIPRGMAVTTQIINLVIGRLKAESNLKDFRYEMTKSPDDYEIRGKWREKLGIQVAAAYCSGLTDGETLSKAVEVWTDEAKRTLASGWFSSEFHLYAQLLCEAGAHFGVKKLITACEAKLSKAKWKDCLTVAAAGAIMSRPGASLLGDFFPSKDLHVSFAWLCRNGAYKAVEFRLNASGAVGAEDLKQGVRAALEDCKPKVLETIFSVTQLESLVLQNAPIRKQQIESLATAFKTGFYIATLDLSRSAIGDDGIRNLSDAFGQLTSLQTLALQDNRIGNGGAEALALAVPNLWVIRKIDLCNNKIKNKGAHELARALSGVNAFEILDLRWNSLSHDGSQALATILPGKCSC